MDDHPERELAIEAKLVLVDPDTLTVTWLNEGAARALTGEAAKPGAPLEQVVPLAASLGVADVVRAVAADGEPRHLAAGLVSTPRGSVAIVTGVYRLPDGAVLLVSEHAWQALHRAPDAGRQRRGAGRGR